MQAPHHPKKFFVISHQVEDMVSQCPTETVLLLRLENNNCYAGADGVTDALFAIGGLKRVLSEGLRTINVLAGYPTR